MTVECLAWRIEGSEQNLHFSGFIFGAAYMLMLIFALLDEIWNTSHQPLQNWGNLLFLGIIATAACFYAWNLATAWIGSVSTSVYLYAQPAVTALAAIPLLGERLTLGTASGIALTVAGLVTAQRRGRAAGDASGKGSEPA